MKILGFLVVIIISSSPIFSFAQTSSSSSASSILSSQNTALSALFKKIGQNPLAEHVTLETFPTFPGAKELVKISLDSSLVDLDKTFIVWTVNGNVSTKGMGKTSFSVRAGSAGETTRVRVTITTSKNEVIQKDVAFHPMGMSLVWEADTYTPPFYRGKALISPQAKVTIVAIPENMDASTLAYVWQRDKVNVPDVSGYGMLAYTTEGPRPYKKVQVGVRASTIDDSLTSETVVDLPLSNPFILFYEKDPLLGTRYERALGKTFDLTKREVSLTAEPYFFSNERGEKPSLTYSWSLNNTPSQNQGRNITLRNDAGVGGLSDVSLLIGNVDKTFQSASRNLRVNFGEVIDTNRPNF